MTEAVIDRAFHRVASGLIHYRYTTRPGEAARTPLVMAHGGPGCSAGLAPLISSLGRERLVVAPDMMGNGDSDPPPIRPTTIAFYADCLLAVMDRLDLECVDLYGHHTGAQVICELAIAHPGRVRRVVLDGVGLFPEPMREAFLAEYAPALVADPGGAHLGWIWTFLTRTTQYFPHYHADAEHRIPGGAALPPAVLTERAAEVLKVWSTYHLAYEAAFHHRFAERLPLVQRPALVLEVGGDPLAGYAREAAELISGARVASIATAERDQAIRAFLDG